MDNLSELEVGLLLVSGLFLIATLGLSFFSIRIFRGDKTLRRERARLQRVYQAANDGIWEWDIASGKSFYSAKFLQLIGMRPEDALSKTPIEVFKRVVHPIDRAYLGEKLNHHLQEGYEHGIDVEFRIVKRRRLITWIWIRGKLIRDPENSRLVLVGLISDIFARKQREERIVSLDHHTVFDSLTELPNRAYLLAHHHQIIQFGVKNDQSAVVMIDVDNFKEVNENFGHGSGDLLLKVLGNRLRQCLRHGDTIVRLGGDEFCIMLAHTNRQQAVEVAQKILASNAEPLNINNHEYIVKLSMGIAMYPDHGEDACVLISKADKAMQFAKQGRLGIAVFDQKLVQVGVLETAEN